MAERLVVAAPSCLFASSSTTPAKQFLLLPHPRSSLPTYFLPSSSSSSSPHADSYDEIYELQATKSDRKARSWFLGGKDDANRLQQGDPQDLSGGKGWVLQDSSLHVISRMDPSFLLLPMLDTLLPSPSSPTDPSSLLVESGPYLTIEDLFEDVSSTLFRRLIQSQSSIVGMDIGSKFSEGEGTWTDIVAFGHLGLARRALQQLCSTQEGTGSDKYYRPSTSAIVALLKRKVKALATTQVFRNHPATLGSRLDRALDDPLTEIARANGQLPPDSGGEADKAKGRRIRLEIALELVRAYVPQGGRVEELFELFVKRDLLRQCDSEERRKEDHEDQGCVTLNDVDDAETDDVLREEESKDTK